VKGTFDLPAPRTERRYQEHEVANPRRVIALRDAIPARPKVLCALQGRHVLSARDLSRKLLVQIFRRAAEFESGVVPRKTPMAGRILISAFLVAANTRTRLSFESASLRQGGSVMTIGGGIGGLETPVDLSEAFNTYGDVVALRTEDQASFRSMLNDSRIPVINAGDGMDENPTQAMVDLYTLFKWRPDLLQKSVPAGRRIRIGIMGEPRQTRTIRSLLLMLCPFKEALERVVVFGRYAKPFSEGQREELEQAGLPLECTVELYPDMTIMECFHKELSRLDMIYVHPIQPLEMSRLGRLEAISLLKPGMMLLHPEVRVKELLDNVDDSPYNGYFAQARAAVFVRMAVLEAILNRT
jgi:aspartate carbamoyltransferase catalytic subunit